MQMRSLEDVRAERERIEAQLKMAPTVEERGSLGISLWRIKEEEKKTIKGLKAREKGGAEVSADQEEKDFYTAEDLAKILQVTKVTIYRLMDQGELPYHQLGKLKRVRRADFEEFLAKSRRGGEGHGRDE